MLSPLVMFSLIPLFCVSQNFIFSCSYELSFYFVPQINLPEFEEILFIFVVPQNPLKVSHSLIWMILNNILNSRCSIIIYWMILNNPVKHRRGPVSWNKTTHNIWFLSLLWSQGTACRKEGAEVRYTGEMK